MDSFLLQGDAARIPLPDKSVHCVVTSPPYWGLRKYSGEQGSEPLGWEPTFDLHIDRMVEICQDVRRVLRDDGVFWINYGDAYDDGNLMLLPHRIAIALQDDGWIIRQDAVWYKRNPMPEAVNGTRYGNKGCDCMKEQREAAIAEAMVVQGTPRHRLKGLMGRQWPADPNCPRCEGTGKLPEIELQRGSWRHTRAHEFVFMAVKGPKYWSDAEAVKEAWAGEYLSTGVKNPRYKYDQGQLPSQADGKPNPKDDVYGGRFTGGNENYRERGRNPRSVIDVPTRPYRGAHYATFPPTLISPLIQATCPRWTCPVCGAGWAPIVESRIDGKPRDQQGTYAKHDIDDNTATWANKASYYGDKISKVHGFRPTCAHPHSQDEAVPGTVFDPFVGSGTTVMVAQELLRRGIGLDISMPYLDRQAKLRTKIGAPTAQLDDLPLFSGLIDDTEA